MNARDRNALIRYHKDLKRNVLARPGIHDFIIILNGLKPGYNIPKIFRSAEAFSAAEVHLVGIGPFDPAAAKGALRKVPIRPHEEFAGCYSELSERGYRLYAMEPQASASLASTALPARSAFIFGNEEFGTSFETENYPDITPLAIPQFGQVQSLNVSNAAAIVMYEYVRQLAGAQSP